MRYGCLSQVFVVNGNQVESCERIFLLLHLIVTFWMVFNCVWVRSNYPQLVIVQSTVLYVKIDPDATGFFLQM